MTQPGYSIGRYRIIQQLGVGGQAAVWLAYDPNLDRQVAIKVLPAEFLGDPDSRERFTREARLIATLQHPNIVPVFDYGEQDGQPYIVMRAMPGGTLSERIRDGSLSAEDMARIVREVGVALDFAHNAGIVHRDVKPANVLFDELGSALIVDFGIARLQEAGPGLTQASVVGTPAYMAPEQARGDSVGPPADLYALGIVAYEMVTGRPPFYGNNAWAIISQHIHDEIPRPTLANPSIPADTEAALLRALQRDPRRRYPSGAEFGTAFARGLGLSPEATIGPSAIALELSPARYGTLGSRFSSARHDLHIVNSSKAALTVSLAVEPRQPPFAIDMPQRANLRPESALSVPVHLRPKRRRWLGPTRTHRFTIHAEAAGEPPVSTSSTHVDQPYGWIPIVGLGVLGVAIVGAFVPLLLRDTQPPPEPRAGIAFVSERDGDKEIYFNALDGGDDENLTNTPGVDEDQPDFSPDGARIAFASDRLGTTLDDVAGQPPFDIWVMDADGSNARALTEDAANDQHPRWSPDGQFIAFDSNRGGRVNPDIFVMRADGSNVLPLTSHDGTDAYPDWSPDGERLVFVSTRDGNPELYLVDRDGRNVQRITVDDGTDFAPTWSPDGRSIAFESDRDGQFAIYVIDVEGLDEGEIPEARRVTEPLSGLAAWSPDGRQIAYFGFAGDADGEAILVIDADGGEPEIVADGVGNDFGPAWSPFVPGAEPES